MYKMKNTLALAVAGLMTVGCASTSSNSNNSGTVQYPVLKVLSDKPYEWDSSISEALNVARMAQPAGVGNGMRDFADGTQATTGRVKGGTRALDAGLGLLSQGIFGVVAMESLNQGVNRQLDWKPAIVQLVSPDDIVDESGELSFLKIRDVVASGVKKSLEKSFGDIEWGGVLTLKNVNHSNVTVIIKNLDICSKAQNYISKKGKSLGYVDINYSEHYINGDNVKEKHCGFFLKTSVVSADKESGKFIIVSEVAGGEYFIGSLINNHEGYVIIPDFYTIRASDSPSGIAIYTNYAYVSKGGEELLFQR